MPLDPFASNPLGCGVFTGGQRPAPRLERVRRIRIVGVSYPSVVFEAVPSAALDVQEMVCVKDVQPEPKAQEPDHCGSNIYTAVVSTLFEWQAILSAFEDLNAPNPLCELWHTGTTPEQHP